jgi:hypothetical protein
MHFNDKIYFLTVYLIIFYILPNQILTKVIMKVLKKATYAIIFTVICASTFQCASPQIVAEATYEEQTPFKVKPVYFHEWYSSIKIGETGIIIYAPVVNKADNIKFDSIYFRDLKGKLTEKGGRYSALLKNKSGEHKFIITTGDSGPPFKLTNDECAISYTENGVTKYIKVPSAKELAGTYYENGPPSIYETSTSTGMASLDEDDVDNDQ